MKKDLHCAYSILDKDISCEHKSGQIYSPSEITLHNHDGYEILLFLNGKITAYNESEGRVLKRGDLIFIRPYCFHGIHPIDIHGYERIVLNIRVEILQRISDGDTNVAMCFERIPTNRMNLIQLDEDEILAFTTLASNLENCITMKPYGHKILELAYLSELLILLNQHTQTDLSQPFSNVLPPIATTVFEYINANLTTNLTVERVADELHHNSDYLSKSIKNVTGYSLKHYITAKKISLAQQYLRQGISPCDVCYMIGYNNYSSFSRRFAEHTGCSPKQYQTRHQTRSS